MGLLSDFDTLQADFNGENGVITKATLLAILGATDTSGTVHLAGATGVDSSGKAYGPTDWIIAFPDGSVVSLAASVDRYTTIGVAGVAGVDAGGNAYNPGDVLAVLPDGDVLKVAHSTGGTTGPDLYAVEEVAATSGTDDAGQVYDAGDILLVFASTNKKYLLSHPSDPGGTTACCVGATVNAYDPANVPSLSGDCGDVNIVAVGALGDFLLDTVAVPINLYESDGSSWQNVPNGTVHDLTSFTCTGGGTYQFFTANGAWIATDPLVAVPNPSDPNTWPAPVAPAVIHFVVDSVGRMLGYVDGSGAHPIACQIGASVIVGTVITAPQLTGLCGDPNYTPVGADGDYLLDVSVSPFNLYEADAGSWDLIPIITIADLTEYSCTNTPDVFLFNATAVNWEPGSQPVPAVADDTSTWGTVTFPVKLKMVYNQDGDLIGVVDATGGHHLDHPDARIGTATPTVAPPTDNSGLSSPWYTQTGVTNPQTEQTDLNVQWIWDSTASAWIEINKLVLPTARTDHRGIVFLAQAADYATKATLDNETATTPAAVRAMILGEAQRDDTGFCEVQDAFGNYEFYALP